jgi:hypothetical protein
LTETHTFSSHLVSSFKAVVQITDQVDSTGPANGFNPANLGFSPSLAAAFAYLNRFPLVNLSNFTNLGSIAGLDRGDNKLAILETVNYVRGNHSIHFGLDARPAQYSQRSTPDGLTLTTNRGWTQKDPITVKPNGSEADSGNSIASFLLGTADSGGVTIPPANFYSLRARFSCLAGSRGE